MELLCEGKKRRVYTHNLGGYPIRARQFEGGSGTADQRNEETGDLEIQWDCHQDVTLNGGFTFKLTLTREDVANLFVAAFRMEPLDRCIEALRRAKLTKIEERSEQRARGG